MSLREANWHAHLAAMRAGNQAAQLGTTPADATALLDAASGGVIVANLRFPPIHAGFLLMLTWLGELKAKVVSLQSDSGSLMAIAYCLGMPDQAWAALRQKDDGARFEAEVFDFAKAIPLPALKALGAWVAEQMATMTAAEEEPPSKQPAEQGSAPTAKTIPS